MSQKTTLLLNSCSRTESNLTSSLSALFEAEYLLRIHVGANPNGGALEQLAGIARRSLQRQIPRSRYLNSKLPPPLFATGVSMTGFTAFCLWLVIVAKVPILHLTIGPPSGTNRNTPRNRLVGRLATSVQVLRTPRVYPHTLASPQSIRGLHRNRTMNSLPHNEHVDEPVETAIVALRAGWASVSDIADAVEARRVERPLIGQLLLKHRKITVHQIFDVLAEEATNNKLFGQIAVEKGYVTPADVDQILYIQQCSCPPLWQQLVSRGVITTAQAESIRTATRKRLRRPFEATPVPCEA